MSALDRAFIKACIADTDLSSPGSTKAKLGPSAEQRADPDQTPHAEPQPSAEADGRCDRRVDGGHAEPACPHIIVYAPCAPPPHAAIPILPPVGDLAIPPPPSVVRPTPAPPPTPAPHVVVDAPPTDPTKSSSPAATHIPPQAPTLFSSEACEAKPQTPGPFVPDWEVDRWNWPSICQRLIEAEARYFQSVGKRLKDATVDSRHVVMITGARRGEGRTTLALCLARCAAQAGIDVALVDADLDNPQLGARLGMETPCSWLRAVVGTSSLSEAAVTSLEDKLTLFPLMQSAAADLQIAKLRSTDLLRLISEHFPLVIVDTGPLQPDDHHPFASGADCPIDTAIVVRDLRNTGETKAQSVARLLQQRGVPAVGIAENFHELEAAD